jgi:hypothetical protein
VRALGYGGLAAVARATGLSRGTIGRGLKDLDHAPLPRGRVRRDGGGRPPLSITNPTLLEDLRQLIEPVTLGDPVRPLRWVSKSHKKLAAALRAQGHTVRTDAKISDAVFWNERGGIPSVWRRQMHHLFLRLS